MRGAVALPFLLLAACASDGRSGAAVPAGGAVVVRPVDGDTVVVDLGGQEEPVRLIAVYMGASGASDVIPEKRAAQRSRPVDLPRYKPGFAQ